MKTVILSLILAASAWAQTEKVEGTITDAQRIAYLKSQNAVLQLAKATDQAAEALKKAIADIAASCPGAQGTPDGDVVCPAPAKDAPKK